jgi:hypothetical protein
MSKNGPATIGSILGKSQFARLLASAGALAKLEAMVRELLPPPLHEHCRVLSVREQTLVLAVDSPVWAARLRFHSPTLVKQLERISTVKLRTVQVCVRAQETPWVATAGKEKTTLSEGSSVALTQTASGVRDPELKQALLRLAARKPDHKP